MWHSVEKGESKRPLVGESPRHGREGGQLERILEKYDVKLGNRSNWFKRGSVADRCGLRSTAHFVCASHVKVNDVNTERARVLRASRSAVSCANRS